MIIGIRMWLHINALPLADPLDFYGSLMDSEIIAPRKLYFARSHCDSCGRLNIANTSPKVVM